MTAHDKDGDSSDMQEETARKRPAGSDDRESTLREPRKTGVYPDPVDDTLDASFPASDPPSWWAG